MARAHAAGVRDVVVDPGIGFGKTVAQNLRLIAEVDRLVAEGWPVLVGVSRKSTVGAVLGTAGVAGAGRRAAVRIARAGRARGRARGVHRAGPRRARDGRGAARDRGGPGGLGAIGGALVTATLALLLQEGLRIGFVPVRWLDLLDIAVTAVLVYQVYRLIRGTIAVQVAVALLGLYAVNEVVRAIGLTTLTTLFGAVGDVFVLAVLILFAPEIRQALFLLGRNPIVRRLVTQPPRQKITDEIIASIQEMSRDRVGSLIAFARSTGLRNYIESGTQISADVERDLIRPSSSPTRPSTTAR